MSARSLMNCSIGCALALMGASVSPAHASDLDTIGLTQLYAEHPELLLTLRGQGMNIGIVEAQSGTNGGQPVYHFDPAASGISNPGAVTFYDAGATGGTTYQSSLNSWHAENVADRFFNVAPAVADVNVYEANYFINSLLSNRIGSNWNPTDVGAKVITQSFAATQDASLNLRYDAYANRFGTLFINGLRNTVDPAPELPYSPASMYNGISVGKLNGEHSVGAQIVAPENYTSFATPYVAGAATLLMQAAEGLPAGQAANASRSTVMKAILLNGATKEASMNWSQTSSRPLDAIYGAGLLNVSNSYKILTGGQKAASTTQVGATAGWDYASLGVGASASYFFDLSSPQAAPYSLTATLTWNSVTPSVTYTAGTFQGSNAVSNFDLVLFDLSNPGGPTEVWRSASTAQYLENIEHIFAQNLAPGQYELRVVLNSAAAGLGQDNYALAFMVTPEPGVPLLLLLGSFALVLRRRRAV